MFEPTEIAQRVFEETMDSTSFLVFTPPPKLTISEWADEFRWLSAIDSAEPGRWRTSRAQYLKGIMDAFNDPEIEGVVVQASAQVGKTQCLNNVVGYFIHQDPAPIMVVQPTQEDCSEWAKDRFMRAMVEITPALRDLIRADRTRQNSDTIHHKQFPGGQLTVAWSNSKSRLASRPIRILLMDEVDKYTTDPGPQGDPVKRAISRTKKFWNRKWGMFSTPTFKNLSRIEEERLAGDDRQYHLPCPECGDFFVLKFHENIRWDKDPKTGAAKPETAYCICTVCGAVIQENKKEWMVQNGKWVAQHPGRSVASFHINELYSSIGPESSWSQIAKRFLEAKGNAMSLQNFVNETLGETWEMQGDTIESHVLHRRREEFADEVPACVCVLTAGVDVQRDRLECSVWGYGPGRESALIDHRVLVGNPAEDAVWAELDGVLMRSYSHELGVNLGVLQTFVDSSDGVHTQRVYRYCKERVTSHVFACKGRASSPHNALPISDRPHKMKSGAFLYTVGVDTAKAQLYSYFKLERPGPGYIHLPKKPFLDEEFCMQLTAEKLTRKQEHFHTTLKWIKMRERNEALDCAVYALAALESRRVDLVTTMINLKKRAKPIQPEPETAIVGTKPDSPVRTVPEPTRPNVPRFPRPRGSSWVNAWRG